jgi:SAM-dependent methyltransferase
MTGEDERRHGATAPSSWVTRFLPLVAPGGAILDVACGSGRHTRLALEKGYRVVAVDRTLAAMEDLAGRGGLELVEADLEGRAGLPVAGHQFDGVIVTNYLWRPLVPQLVAAVAPAGVLIYETFARGQERFGRPSNPDFLLRPGELIDVVRHDLVVVAYEHGRLADPPRLVQRIAAVGRESPHLADPPAL